MKRRGGKIEELKTLSSSSANNTQMRSPTELVRVSTVTTVAMKPQMLKLRGRLREASSKSDDTRLFKGG